MAPRHRAGSQKLGLCAESGNRHNAVHVSGGCAAAPLETPACSSHWKVSRSQGSGTDRPLPGAERRDVRGAERHQATGRGRGARRDRGRGARHPSATPALPREAGHRQRDAMCPDGLRPAAHLWGLSDTPGVSGFGQRKKRSCEASLWGWTIQEHGAGFSHAPVG